MIIFYCMLLVVMTMIDPDDYILLYVVIFQCLQFRSVDYRYIWFFNVIVDFPINIVNKCRCVELI